MTRSKRATLPVRTPGEVLNAFPAYRQSLLAEADQCMLRTRWRLEVAEGLPPEARHDRTWDTAEAARGILAHRYSAAIVRTLWETGQVSIPVAEALEVLYEVCAQRDVPDRDVVYVPAIERRLLRMYAVRLVSEAGQLRTWNMSRVLHVEERFNATVPITDAGGNAAERTITGQPDAVLADPPDGLVVLDWKSTPKAPPKAPDRKLDADGRAHGEDVPGNISAEGFFQQRVYTLILLANFAEVSRVTLREVYPLDPDGLQVRKATLYRADLERITREVGTGVELLDRAITGGSGSEMWKPQPGRHCGHCPRPGSCPIPREERKEGAITGPKMAEDYAADLAVSDGVRQHRRKALKAWHEATGRPIPVRDAKGRYEWRFEQGSRSFGLHAVRAALREPEDRDLSAIFREAAERRRAA